VRARWYGGIAAAALAVPGIALAQVETRASVDVSAGVGYSTNPFARVGDDLGSGYALINVAPQLRLLTPKSTVTISGAANVQEYFQHYADATSYRVAVDYQGRPSARLNTRLHVDAGSSIIGAYDSIGDQVIDPNLPPPTDIALFGSRDRRRSINANGGFDLALSARDSIGASAFYQIARYRDFGDISDYDAFGGTFSYNRQLSANTRIGLQGSVSRYDYRGDRGQTTAYSISPTISTKLSELWTLDGSLGVSLVDSTSRGSTSKASVSGSANLCRQGPLSTFCINASRSVRPTGYNGSQYVNLIGASWSRKLSERDTISARAAYTTEGGARSVLFPGLRAQFLNGSVTYDKRLSERLRLSATGRYRKIFSNSSLRPDDIGGLLTLSYRLGDLR